MAKKKKAVTEKPKHSPIGASSMSRWEACPGSIRLSEGQPNIAGRAALEGTAAHEVIGLAMERGFSEQVDVRTVLEKIVDAVMVYSDYCKSLIKGGNPYHIEHAFDMSAIFPMLYGTADFCAYEMAERHLHVVDYKNGVGLPVEAKGNKQLQYYGLGALTTLPYRPTKVTMTIVQPRCYHPEGPIRSWTVPALHFIDFEADLVAAAKETEKKNAKLSAGSHCMFCLAKDCPERHKAKVAGAKRDFKFYKDPKDDFEPVNTDLDWDIKVNGVGNPLKSLFD